MGGRWIWSETVALPELVLPATLRLLRDFHLGPLVAVQPHQLDSIADATARLRDEGISFGLWPMLGDDAGRWASVANMLDYLAFCDQVLERAGAAPPAVLAIDLEPRIDWVRPLVGGALPRLGRGSGSSFGAARSALISYIASLHARGVDTLAAAIPLVLHDPPGQAGWQRLLGTPVTGIGFRHVTVMAYPSLVEGWSRGVLRRAHARELLGVWSQRARAIGAGLSLGVVGVGALGDEPRYRFASELAEDVAVARAHGIDSLILHDLGGVLAHSPAETWLKALSPAATAAASAAGSHRVRSIVAALDAGGRLLS